MSKTDLSRRGLFGLAVGAAVAPFVPALPNNDLTEASLEHCLGLMRQEIEFRARGWDFGITSYRRFSVDHIVDWREAYGSEGR